MKHKLLSAATGIVFLAACTPDPQAAFETDKSSYTAGETVHLTNTSEDAENYVWSFNGQTATSEHLDIEIAEDYGSGAIDITLTAFSKNDKKDDSYSTTINVEAATGQAMFWQAPECGCGLTTVTVNGQTAVITSDYSSIPTCGSAGTANFTLDVGTYPYSATDGVWEWNGSINVYKDECSKTQLL